MKLYYSPAACSLSPHIVLHEAGLKFDPVLVTLNNHQLKDGSNFYSYNPLGYVPLLELDNGTRLAEGPAIVQYIADQVPDKKLAPPNGSLARYQLQSLLNPSLSLLSPFLPLPAGNPHKQWGRSRNALLCHNI